MPESVTPQLEVIEQKWTKLVKTETLWIGWTLKPLHIINDSVEAILAPGDAIVDHEDEREICRRRDAIALVKRENWKYSASHTPGELQSAEPHLHWAVYERQLDTIEYANHVADGMVHPDLYVVKVGGVLRDIDRGSHKVPQVVRWEAIQHYLDSGYTVAD